MPNHAFRESHRLLRRWLILLFVLCFSGVYEGRHLKRGWVPWDAGAYAESADRVLHGQLPHRDFVDAYTGGLSYLNAASMRLFGQNLAAERLMLLLFFLAWVPALYQIAAQFCRDWVAGAVVILAVTWSLPIYSEAVPSWYNLFFATFGVAALLAYLKRPSSKWLVLAGVCGGLSFLAKSVGLCYVAAVLFFFVFREQTTKAEAAATSSETHESPRMRLDSPAYTVFVLPCVLVFLLLLVRLVLPLTFLGAGAAAGESVLFLLPAASLCLVLVGGELKSGHRAGSALRFARLLRMCLPFGAGIILPMVVFLAPYFRAHASGALVRDLFAQASARIAAAYHLPDAFATVIPAVFLISAVGVSAILSQRGRWILFAGTTGLLAVGVILSFAMWPSYIAVWSAAYWLPPLVVVLGCAILLSRWLAGADNLGGSQPLFLVLSVTALSSLVEFPYTAPVYFCYIAPLALLAMAAVVQPLARVSRAMLGMVYTVFLVFAVFVVTPGFVFVTGSRYQPDEQTAVMNLSRAGNLRISSASAAIYDQLVPLIRKHAGSGEIYAGPDCPEVYFLSGYANLTPDLYDFLDPSAEQPGQMIARISNAQVRVVVINNHPPLSPPLDAGLRGEIVRRFPAGEVVGNFEVRWREQGEWPPAHSRKSVG